MAKSPAEIDEKFEGLIAWELNDATSMLTYAEERSHTMIGQNSLLQLLIRRRGEIGAYVKEHEKGVVQEIRRTGVVAKPKRSVVIVSCLPFAFVEKVEKEFKNHLMVIL